MSLSSQVRRQLQGMAEPGYAAFSASLIPGVQAMLGVRLPRLRALAARHPRPLAEPSGGRGGNRRERSQRLWKNCVKGLDFCGNID